MIPTILFVFVLLIIMDIVANSTHKHSTALPMRFLIALAMRFVVALAVRFLIALAVRILIALRKQCRLATLL
jgi:hypothetical protein